MAKAKSPDENGKLEKVIAEANKQRLQREISYRDRALKMYPWVCGKCQREFTRTNVQELTVHHRDHNHDNNPEDGSNWELLCLYCHDNEHSRLLDGEGTGPSVKTNINQATHNPFAGLKSLLKNKE